MSRGSPPEPRFPAATTLYDSRNQNEFRTAVERALRELTQYLTGALTQTPDPLVAGENHDYDPGPIATTLRLTPDAGGSTLTGLSQPVDGRVLRLINVGTSDLTLAHEHAGSSEDYRLASPTEADIVVGPEESATLEYDATTGRWRVINYPIVVPEPETVPRITGLSVNVFDFGGDDTYDIVWTVNPAVTDPGYDMEILAKNDKLNTFHSATEVSPLSTQSTEIVAAEGDGVADVHMVLANLKDSEGNIIDSKSVMVTSLLMAPP